MAFINSIGEGISYDCSDLIEELRDDIDEFGGDTVVNVWCREDQGVTLYTNYDFIDEEAPVQEDEIHEDEYIEQMTMTALMILFEQQNEIL